MSHWLKVQYWWKWSCEYRVAVLKELEYVFCSLYILSWCSSKASDLCKLRWCFSSQQRFNWKHSGLLAGCGKPGNGCSETLAFVHIYQVEKVITVMSNPRQYKIPDWFLNRQKDIKDGKYTQALSNVLDSKIRDDLERLKKIRAHRGLRHYWGYAVLLPPLFVTDQSVAPSWAPWSWE